MFDSPRDSFVKAICDDPFDDAPRLIFADWLTENGEEYYGEFIRVQVSLSHLQKQCTTISYSPEETCDRDNCPYHKLYNRQVALWRTRFPGDDPFGKQFDSSIFEEQHDPPFALFRRGFVSEMIFSLSDYLTHAKAIARTHPITRWVLTDRKPEKMPMGFIWRASEKDCPRGFQYYPASWLSFDFSNKMMDTFPTESAALATLETVLYKLARE